MTLGGDPFGAKDESLRPAVAPEVDLESASFDPKKYLATVHAATSYAGLQNELKELRRTTSDKTEQLKALVSAHFDQYLSCHEAVRSLAEDIRAHQRDNETLVTDMKALQDVTDSTLSVMLQRAKEQRHIRNTLAVLTRLRPVLDITTKMKESLQNKDYDKLAEDYCRLKYHSHKSNLVVLQRVFTAAHEIAASANSELLKHFDDFSLSVQDQKRAIGVLSTLGLVEKPELTCLTKQFDFLERRLGELEEEKHANAVTMINACGEIIYRFRTGLWSLICDLFKTPAGSTAKTLKGHASITSSDAETIQLQAWNIVSKCARILERYAHPPTAQILKTLNEVFRHIQSLKKCPNAATLNANIAKLNTSFCEEFRVKVVLEFLKETCAIASTQLMKEYFDSIVTSIPSLPAESFLSIGENDITSGLPILTQESSSTAAKVGKLVVEARDAFDGIWNSSMVSSEVKVQLSRPPLFTRCCDDIIHQWDLIWQRVGEIIMDTIESDTDKSSHDATKSNETGIRSVIVRALAETLHEMLSSMLNRLFDAFMAVVTPPTKLAASSRSSNDGARVCILFAIVSNCVELRQRCLSRVGQWFSAIDGGNDVQSRAAVQSMHQLVKEMETKCIKTYVTLHSEPLMHIVRAGASEEPQQNRAGSSSSQSRTASRTASLSVSSRTNSSAGFELPLSPTAGGIAAGSLGSGSSPLIPNDPRQYVFNVLLQLIALRGEVEIGLGVYPDVAKYVQAVSHPLTANLAQFLDESTRELGQETSTPNSSVAEWKRIHLAVETRFFLQALDELMTEETKAQLAATEKELLQGKMSEKAVAARGVLLNQLKHQTKLYLLALQQRV